MQRADKLDEFISTTIESFTPRGYEEYVEFIDVHTIGRITVMQFVCKLTGHYLWTDGAGTYYDYVYHSLRHRYEYRKITKVEAMATLFLS